MDHLHVLPLVEKVRDNKFPLIGFLHIHWNHMVKGYIQIEKQFTNRKNKLSYSCIFPPPT